MMKSEERIIYLLSDMVRKQDRQEQILNQHSELLNRIVNVIDHQNGRLAELTDVKERLARVEQHLGL